MNIAGSCEAYLCLVARLPVAALNARLFHKVCDELVDEVGDMHRELRDKFRYDAGGVQAYVQDHGGMGPAAMPPLSPTILSDAEAWQIIQDVGRGRYRLPRPGG